MNCYIIRMNAPRAFTFGVLILLAVATANLFPSRCCLAEDKPATTRPSGISDDDRKEIEESLFKANSLFAKLQTKLARPETAHVRDHLADAAVFRKASFYAMQYETKLAPADVKLLKKDIGRFSERALSLLDN